MMLPKLQLTINRTDSRLRVSKACQLGEKQHILNATHALGIRARCKPQVSRKYTSTVVPPRWLHDPEPCLRLSSSAPLSGPLPSSIFIPITPDHFSPNEPVGLIVFGHLVIVDCDERSEEPTVIPGWEGKRDKVLMSPHLIFRPMAFLFLGGLGGLSPRLEPKQMT